MLLYDCLDFVEKKWGYKVDTSVFLKGFSSWGYKDPGFSSSGGKKHGGLFTGRRNHVVAFFLVARGAKTCPRPVSRFRIRNVTESDESQERATAAS